jgi:hypothetical protein
VYSSNYSSPKERLCYISVCHDYLCRPRETVNSSSAVMKQIRSSSSTIAIYLLEVRTNFLTTDDTRLCFYFKFLLFFLGQGSDFEVGMMIQATIHEKRLKQQSLVYKLYILKHTNSISMLNLASGPLILYKHDVLEKK